VRNASEDAVELNECPTCRRPWRNDERESDTSDRRGRPGSRNNESFVKSDYFDLLAESRRQSPAGSGSSTPFKRFTPAALRSGRSRDVSGAHGPPPGPEFVSSAPATFAEEGISSSAFNEGAYERDFREIRELGRGGNGVVLLVEHVLDRISLGQFACKRIPVGNDHDWLNKALTEVRILRRIPHKNLVPYHWVWVQHYRSSDFGPSIPHLFILQEYCIGGDLHAHVMGPKAPDNDSKEKLKERVRRHSRGEMEPLMSQLHGPSQLTFEEILSFFRDITSGLHHLHSKGYIHRDLKPANCLIQKSGNRSTVLISDFGEVQAAGTQRGSSGATGTISYCAPEVLQQNPADGRFGQFTAKSDIFSLGMIVYFMCFGRLPYSMADDINEENEDMDELRAEILKWSGFNDKRRARPDLPEELYKYLRKLLSVHPNERPSTEDILTSINGGVDPGEPAGSPLFEENSSRVSNVDSPRSRPSPHSRNKNQAFVSGPGLSSLPRRISDNDVRPGPKSPARRRSRSSQRRTSTPTSPLERSEIIRRPRHVDLPPPSEETKSPPQSPRLMLPAPPAPRTSTSRILHLAHHPITLVLLRTTLFLGKLVSLTWPCSPFATSRWLLYPLLAVAALDLGLLPFDPRRTLLLLAAHVTTVILAAQHGRLCEFRGTDGWGWDDMTHDDT